MSGPRRRRGRRRSGQLTYWEPAAPESPPAPEPAGPRDPLHGYTVHDIHQIARMAAAANRWLVSDFTIRYEHAWDAVIDALLTAADRPSPHDLAAVAKGAVSRALLKDFCHTYGVADRDLTAGIGSAPRFAAYWSRPPGTPLDEAVTERIAAAQIWAALDVRHARILETFAACGDNQAAAAALGIPRSSFSQYASQARNAFAALWFEHETPPRRPRRPQKYSASEWNTSRQAACGTPGAYRRHLRHGEAGEECGCRAAYLRHENARSAARRRRRRLATADRSPA
jgi:hypothetical protein